MNIMIGTWNIIESVTPLQLNMSLSTHSIVFILFQQNQLSSRDSFSDSNKVKSNGNLIIYRRSFSLMLSEYIEQMNMKLVSFEINTTRMPGG